MTSSYTNSEEAFVYSSFREIIKVWAREAGNASFSIDIHDGAAQLQLKFFLGNPSEPHVLPFSPQQMPNSTVNIRKRKRKSPSNKRRDQRRAEH